MPGHLRSRALRVDRLVLRLFYYRNFSQAIGSLGDKVREVPLGVRSIEFECRRMLR